MPDVPSTRLVYDALLITSLDDAYKPATGPRVTGLGIGAALLAELVLSQHLTVWAAKGVDRVCIDPMGGTGEGYRPPDDSLALWLVEHVRAEHASLPVRDWLDFLSASDVYTKTAEHMAMLGFMVRREYRSRWRQRVEVGYEPSDPLIANAVFSRLRRHLSLSEGSISVEDAFLLALTEAVGLSKPLYHQLPSGARVYAGKRRQALPAALRAVLAHLAASVADIAITGGR
ncbi:GPP34 family phosphoprotein [Glycomyces luteolus]|uniref:GPP34 family phosphoprotein n=1 Tax=Glycomyces luteolus TaxID=2670330 RepID=A0A9X3P8I3_9ACTN|nr:GPP34 family phosphoprotein [Glycomyces luteolus]MDA1358937.1 GPP34 family phosphoprotein [Glycomyces luteolus]